MLGQGLAKASLVSQCALVVSTRAARRGDQPQIPMPFSPVPALLLAHVYTLTGRSHVSQNPRTWGSSLSVGPGDSLSSLFAVGSRGTYSRV